MRLSLCPRVSWRYTTQRWFKESKHRSIVPSDFIFYDIFERNRKVGWFFGTQLSAKFIVQSVTLICPGLKEISVNNPGSAIWTNTIILRYTSSPDVLDTVYVSNKRILQKIIKFWILFWILKRFFLFRILCNAQHEVHPWSVLHQNRERCYLESLRTAVQKNSATSNDRPCVYASRDHQVSSGQRILVLKKERSSVSFHFTSLFYGRFGFISISPSLFSPGITTDMKHDRRKTIERIFQRLLAAKQNRKKYW